MATRLLPPEDGPKLTASEICRRIDDEFEHVEFDADEGQDQVGSMIETFVRLKAPKAILDWHVNVRDSAVHVFERLRKNATFNFGFSRISGTRPGTHAGLAGGNARHEPRSRGFSLHEEQRKPRSEKPRRDGAKRPIARIANPP